MTSIGSRIDLIIGIQCHMYVFLGQTSLPDTRCYNFNRRWSQVGWNNVFIRKAQWLIKFPGGVCITVRLHNHDNVAKKIYQTSRFFIY